MSLTATVFKKEQGVFVVSVFGSLDSITYTELEKRLQEVLLPSTKALILNMEGVEYISSMGVSVVLKTKKLIEENGGTLLLSNLRPQIKAVFDIIKALPNMRIFQNLEEADVYLSAIQRKEIEKQKGSHPF